MHLAQEDHKMPQPLGKDRPSNPQSRANQQFSDSPTEKNCGEF